MDCKLVIELKHLGDESTGSRTLPFIQTVVYTLNTCTKQVNVII